MKRFTSSCNGFVLLVVLATSPLAAQAANPAAQPARMGLVTGTTLVRHPRPTGSRPRRSPAGIAGIRVVRSAVHPGFASVARLHRRIARIP